MILYVNVEVGICNFNIDLFWILSFLKLFKFVINKIIILNEVGVIYCYKINLKNCI